jgi:sugar phosphate isomerase/epimerase
MKLSVFYDHIVEAHEQTGKDIDSILKYVKECDIDALEVRLSHLQEDEEASRRIKQAGLSVSCIFEFYDMGKADETEKIKAHLDMAKELSAPNIMIVPGFLEGGDVDKLKEYMKDEAKLYSFFDSHDEVKRMAEGINKAVAMGKEMGITVLFEDFDDFSSPMSGINGVAWFLDNCPGVSFTFDCGNFIMYDEDVLLAFDKFFPRIKHVHCKDRSAEAIPVGDGRIPIKEVVTRLVESGYDGYFAIEHFDAKDQMGFIGKSAGFLNSI